MDAPVTSFNGKPQATLFDPNYSVVDRFYARVTSEGGTSLSLRRAWSSTCENKVPLRG